MYVYVCVCAHIKERKLNYIKPHFLLSTWWHAIISWLFFSLLKNITYDILVSYLY